MQGSQADARLTTVQCFALAMVKSVLRLFVLPPHHHHHHHHHHHTAPYSTPTTPQDLTRLDSSIWPHPAARRCSTPLCCHTARPPPPPQTPAPSRSRTASRHVKLQPSRVQCSKSSSPSSIPSRHLHCAGRVVLDLTDAGRGWRAVQAEASCNRSQRSSGQVQVPSGPAGGCRRSCISRHHTHACAPIPLGTLAPLWA
ncbi:uncharacterized protein IWZ02DRAFT_86307 [Phyllosticta citriasiana]|uniref:uncharacterized protein n=1 Tax=Phyllosticta citriasiana TaxID=595635 RepID=UPI0030FDB04A